MLSSSFCYSFFFASLGSDKHLILSFRPTFDVGRKRCSHHVNEAEHDENSKTKSYHAAVRRTLNHALMMTTMATMTWDKTVKMCNVQSLVIISRRTIRCDRPMNFFSFAPNVCFFNQCSVIVRRSQHFSSFFSALSNDDRLSISRRLWHTRVRKHKSKSETNKNEKTVKRENREKKERREIIWKQSQVENEVWTMMLITRFLICGDILLFDSIQKEEMSTRARKKKKEIGFSWYFPSHFTANNSRISTDAVSDRQKRKKKNFFFWRTRKKGDTNNNKI